LSTAVAKLRRVFNFHLLFYYMAEASSSTFNPRARCLLQLQSSSPTSSLFNFNPPCQLHPSSPTSTLVAFQIEGIERLMRRQNPDKGLKLIGDAAAEDSGSKYFLAMLKYRCNPADPEAMALLQEISGGLRPLTAVGRTPTCGGCATSLSKISTTLCGGTGLMTVTTTTFHCCPS
jgi:hypothetical protein